MEKFEEFCNRVDYRIDNDVIKRLFGANTRTVKEINLDLFSTTNEDLLARTKYKNVNIGFEVYSDFEYFTIKKSKKSNSFLSLITLDKIKSSAIKEYSINIIGLMFVVDNLRYELVIEL